MAVEVWEMQEVTTERSQDELENKSSGHAASENKGETVRAAGTVIVEGRVERLQNVPRERTPIDEEWSEVKV